jgi:hypothetical protein
LASLFFYLVEDGWIYPRPPTSASSVAKVHAHCCTDAHLLPQFLSSKPPVVQPQSIPLRVANWCLLGAGLFLLGFSRNPILHALGGGLGFLGILSIERGYKIAKARRLELYAEEINRRMQNAPATPPEDQKP